MPILAEYLVAVLIRKITVSVRRDRTFLFAVPHVVDVTNSY